MDPESNVRYVVAGNPTGWAGIAKTIRDVDEDTIEDYKEDIDTLLVFTGLFSAVLTAFVVESYQQLSPDPMAPVVKLLEHIAGQTQNYTITSNTINSTFSPTAEIEAAFEPPLSAVRVNQLWFASLAITLITASFAMLVKQWLREYLAMAYTSPHDRIRARQYRHPSLQAWKVLEIAGILPLLLQVALGLFFLGLCFFTFSVNAGVGKGSTVLVSTWIFLFVSVTLAPVASPRCPYKTAILQNLMVKVRRWMSGLLYSASVHAAMRTVFEILRSIGLSSNSPCQSLPPRGQHWVEESEALQQDVNELDILKEVDAFLLDDDLLGTTIFDSLTQYHPTPSTIIEFVLQALNLRLKGVLITQPLNSTPDLRRLTKRGWMAVSDIVANTILNNIGKQGSEIGGWYEDAIHILFAGSDHPLTPTASKALVHSIHKSTISSFTAVLASLTPMPDILIRRFHDVLGPLEDQLIGMIDDTVTTATSPQASDITNLALQLLTLEGLDVQDYRLFRSIISRLQSLPAHTWVWGMDLIAKAVVRRLDAAGHAPLGTWLEEAFRLFLFPFNQSVTSTASTALVSLLRKSTIAHFVKLLDSLASQSQLVMPRLRDLLPPLSHHSAELIHKGDALPSDIIRFVFRLYMLEVNDAQTTLPLRCIVDLQSLPEQTWIVGSDLLGMLLRQINTDAASVGGGAETWFEDAHYLLLSAPNRPLTATTREALVCSIQKSTISRFTNLLGSLIPVSESTPVAPVLRDLTGSAELSAHITRLIRRSELPPEDVIPLVCRLYELDGGRLLLARPYPRVIDLQTLSPPVWTSGSHIIGETILQSLDKEKNANGIGSWLEDAVATLLATPPCPLHATAINALAALCKENAQRERFDQCIRIAASPASSQYPHVIAIFRDVCKQLSTDDDMCRLLWTLLWSIPCSSKCTHPRPSYMGPLFHDHIQDHEDWAGHYVPLLVDRIIGLVTVQGLWPPAVDISLRALMSCPVPLHQLHADAPGILWDILATFSTSGNALHNLVGADEKWHSSVKMDVAIENVVSLFADVDNEGRRRFLRLKSDQCKNYIAESTFYADAELNVIRLCHLITRMYAKVQSDRTLHEAFYDFYTICSQAMKRFRTDNFLSIAETEQRSTVRLAEESLSRLDSPEPTAEGTGFDEWASSFHVEESAFPDELFERLASFVSEEVAVRIKRIRRLRASGVGRETSPTPAAEPEDAEASAEGSSASEADPNANVSSGRNGDSGAIISSAGEHGPHAGVGVAEVTGKDSGTTDQMEIRPASVGRGGSVDGQNDGDGGTASKDAEELSDHGTVEFVRDVSHGPADRHNIATTQGDGEETNEVILEEAVDKEEVGDARSGQSG